MPPLNQEVFLYKQHALITLIFAQSASGDTFKHRLDQNFQNLEKKMVIFFKFQSIVMCAKPSQQAAVKNFQCTNTN